MPAPLLLEQQIFTFGNFNTVLIFIRMPWNITIGNIHYVSVWKLYYFLAVELIV